MTQRPRLLALASAIALSSQASPARAEMDPTGYIAGVMVMLPAATAMVAVAPSLPPDQVAFSRLGGGALLAAGGSLGLLGALLMGLMPRDDDWAATAAFGTFIEGQLMGLSGIGIGALAKPHTRLPWLGGSIGHGATATYQGILAMAGQNDYAGTGASQAVLGAIGAAGCFLDTHFAAGAERGVSIGCGVVSSLAAVHGVVMAATSRARHPYYHAPSRHRRALVPMPWFQRDVAGVMLGGSF